MGGEYQSGTGSSFFDLWKNPLNETARARFVARYRPKVFSWARQFGLNEADADDVTQILLIKALQGFGTYDPKKGRFRDWLKAATRNTGRHLLAAERRARRVATDEKLRALLARPEADDALARLTDAMLDQELFLIACERVQMQVSRAAWEGFRRKVLEGEPVTVISATLGTTPAAICQACSRIRKQLRQEIERLEDDSESPLRES